MTPNAADAASILDFSEKCFLRKDADAKNQVKDHEKIFYVNGGTQEGKFIFVKIFLHLCINGGAQA